MTPNPWEHHAPMKAMYRVCMDPVCSKHGLSRTEMDILLFLANNPQYDTAADVVQMRFLAKSHVSTSLRSLELAGLVEKHYQPGDRRAVHLRLTDAAAALVADGRRAQARFSDELCKGLSGEQLDTLDECLRQIYANVRTFFAGGAGPCR